ncbi:spore coat protein F [Thalassobacillus cyri]|uniref:Spore coat protein F n=1 Tax=Thalassobacillus cyri TaxID=571932 RepID=A0A1H4C1H3_9BACI|nr:spore coat protein [Thalassobacillus cyri]SEA54295.1 spore coat protein F [Thalassobacillus cyri]
MYQHYASQAPQHLAWHETLDLHELVAFQSIGLMKLKKAYPKVTDPTLKKLYQQAINSLSKNLQELLAFYPLAPHPEHGSDYRDDELPFYAGDLLALFKTGVRNYAIAITETATPALRKVLKQQINNTIDMHAAVYSYMYQNGYYPSYNLTQLLSNDINLAKKALSKGI